MLISIISTLISSIALLGVALGLLLQARQLRASQIRLPVLRKVELLRFAIDNPGMVSPIDGIADIDKFVKYVIRNWYFTYLSMSYDNSTITKTALQRVANTAFRDGVTRNYWAEAGNSFYGVATSRRKKNSLQ